MQSYPQSKPNEVLPFSNSRARAFEKSSAQAPSLQSLASHVMMPPPLITQPKMYAKLQRGKGHKLSPADVAREYDRHPFIQIYSTYQRSNLLLEMSDGTVRTTRDTKDKRSKFSTAAAEPACLALG